VNPAKDQEMLKTLTAAFTLCMLAGAAMADVLWIQPAQYHPDNKAILGVHIRSGVGFPGHLVPRDASALDQFYSVGPDGRAELSGTPGRDPAGLARPVDVGVHVIVCTFKPITTTMASGAFDQFLKDEGLAVTNPSQAHGEVNISLRDTRFAKAIICCEKTNAAEVWKKPTGLALELVPDADPYTLSPGAEMPFLLLADGRPVENAQVRAASQKRPQDWTKARTDTQGRVRFKLEDSGVWLLCAVQMKPQPESAGQGGEWATDSTSLTFELPGPDTKTIKGQPIKLYQAPPASSLPLNPAPPAPAIPLPK